MDNFDPKLYKNLISLVKMFENRPFHLIKFLMSKDAFTKEFKDLVMQSGFLDNLENQEEDYLTVKKVYFVDIAQMNDFFNSLFVDLGWDKNKTPDLSQELNSKLDRYIREEKYEDAIRIRDYMNKMGIKRISPEDF